MFSSRSREIGVTPQKSAPDVEMQNAAFKIVISFIECCSRNQLIQEIG